MRTSRTLFIDGEGRGWNAHRMNQRRVHVWHSAGSIRRKTAPTGY